MVGNDVNEDDGNDAVLEEYNYDANESVLRCCAVCDGFVSPATLRFDQ